MNNNLETAINPTSHPLLGQHCVIRTYAAGVHLGTVEAVYYSPAGVEVQLVNARRLFWWEGAFTLSAVAQAGISGQSLISCEVPIIHVMNVIEILPTSLAAREIYPKYYDKNNK